jgi:hypothetical protein
VIGIETQRSIHSYGLLTVANIRTYDGIRNQLLTVKESFDRSKTINHIVRQSGVTDSRKSTARVAPKTIPDLKREYFTVRWRMLSR